MSRRWSVRNFTWHVISAPTAGEDISTNHGLPIADNQYSTLRRPLCASATVLSKPTQIEPNRIAVTLIFDLDKIDTEAC